MSLTYPDVSRYTPTVDLSPYVAVCARSGMSDGTHGSIDETDPTYLDYKAQGKLFSAYHWINHLGGVADARHCFSIVGPDVSVMIDAEDMPGNTGYNGPLTPMDIIDFADEMAALGGHCWGAYIPHWYWMDHMGSPDLTWMVAKGLVLVASDYTTYSDGGPGWTPYGGVRPTVWQYAGGSLDRNAFLGTTSDLAALWGLPVLVSTPPTPTPAPPAGTTEVSVATMPVLQQGAQGGAVRILEGLLVGHGYATGANGAAVIDGDFGPTVHASVIAFQASRGLLQDGIVGQLTYTQLLRA